MPTLAAEEAEKLRAFEQRIQLEGAAAFADGPAPWEQWEDVGTLGTYQVWHDTTRHPPQERAPRKPLTTRLLTGLAQLAVLALLVGTAGVYLSIVTTDQRLAGNGVEPPPIVLAGRSPLRPVTDARPVIRDPADTLARSGAVTEAAAPGSVTDTAAMDTAPAPAMTAAAGQPAAAEVVTPPVATVIPLHLEQAPSAGNPAPAADPALALEELPATAAGPLTGTVPAPDAAPVAGEADPNTQRVAQGTPDAEMAPQRLALLTPPIDTLPEKPAARPAPAQAARDLTDTWVVNLASYNFESMARRKLAAFRDKGVNAELVKITVKGKPMIRIRATGYESRREASDWVALLEERLKLEGAWVARYQPGEE